MKGGGYGVVMDIVLGILGAIVGGWILRAEHLARRGNYWRDSGGVCRCGTFGLDCAAA